MRMRSTLVVVVAQLGQSWPRIAADSGDFFRSSYLALDGAGAAPITEANFKNLPGGDYEVTVSLVNAEGHTTSIDRRFIMVTSTSR